MNTGKQTPPIYLLFIALILLIIPTVTAEVKLIDVDADGTACIFDVNGKTAVVNERDTKTVNGYRIWVKEAHPLNSEARDEDKCEALISFVGGPGIEVFDEEKEELFPQSIAKGEDSIEITEEEPIETEEIQEKTPPQEEQTIKEPITKLTLKQKIIKFFKTLFQLN